MSIGGITVAYSTLVSINFDPGISRLTTYTHLVIWLRQAIPLHTFIMVWYSKGYHALTIAWIAISIPWIFSLVYFIALGSAYPSGPNKIFRPAPVCCIAYRSSNQSFYSLSTGAGLARAILSNASSQCTSGCGLHSSSPCSYTSHCPSGSEETSQSAINFGGSEFTPVSRWRTGGVCDGLR
jgi:hypothetical protein